MLDTTRKRPGAVTVLALLFLAFGALNTLLGLGLLATIALGPAVPPATATARALVVYLVAGSAFVPLGVGLLKLRRWARVGSIAFCVLFYLWIAGFNLARIPGGRRAEPVEWVGLAMSLILSLVVLGLPVLVLTRPGVRAAFARRPTS